MAVRAGETCILVSGARGLVRVGDGAGVCEVALEVGSVLGALHFAAVLGGEADGVPVEGVADCVLLFGGTDVGGRHGLRLGWFGLI